MKKTILSRDLEHPQAFSEIVTNSASMRFLFQLIETISRTDRQVLITGETGVGKELMAQALHVVSGRKGPLVVVNVAGLDDNAFSDTLFGHLKGAFTGADKNREGLIKRASGGTLFLDEIGDLSPASQVKLLRLLQEREYLPLGADSPRQTDARIVMATNRDLDALQKTEKFRQDLYFRLQTHRLNIPPLRERPDDLPLLVEHFLEKASTALEKNKPTYPGELFALLGSHHFPGNVRELETMIFDAVSHHKSRMLSLERFKLHIQKHHSPVTDQTRSPHGTASMFSQLEMLPTMKEVHKTLISEALKRSNGNQTVAAKLLGMSQPGLSKALKRDGLQQDET